MALFMVVMVLTIISAIGVYSARSSSQLDLASGNSRRALQAQYAAEFAMRALAADVAGIPDVYKQKLTGALGARGDCRFQNSPTCVRDETADIMVRVIDPNLPAGLIGSLNHDAVASLSPANGINNGETGTFSIEMDDLGILPGGLAGYSNTKSYQFTVLTVGQIMPAGAPAGTCTDAFTIASGLQRLRGQVIFGPFPE
jgi:hypothetical protein